MLQTTYAKHYGAAHAVQIREKNNLKNCSKCGRQPIKVPYFVLNLANIMHQFQAIFFFFSKFQTPLNKNVRVKHRFLSTKHSPMWTVYSQMKPKIKHKTKKIAHLLLKYTHLDLNSKVRKKRYEVIHIKCAVVKLLDSDPQVGVRSLAWPR